MHFAKNLRKYIFDIFSYYCDVCNHLSQIDSITDQHAADLSKQQARVVDQFRGLKCPNEPGLYRMEKKFCFNDWAAFDEDHNCKIDLLEKAANELGSYKNAFEALQQLGFVGFLLFGFWDIFSEYLFGSIIYMLPAL